jgi:ArsR family transcriptional regulator, arsenate/arsenite/antimonite-responsive transcriptional repressor
MELIDSERMKAIVERTKGVCCPPTIPLPLAKVDASVEVLKAVADPTRLQMMGVLKRATQPVCICDFTAAFDLSQPTISHHMGKLKDAGLVEATKSGIWAYYRLARNLDTKTRALLDVLV